MPHDVSDAELEAAARPYTPLFRVHPEDHLFAYHLAHIPNGVEIYFKGGRGNAIKMRDVMARWWGDKPARVLEFAAGYGRVTRHREALFAGHDYVASDIHPAACAFMAAEFGVGTVQSHEDPARLVLDGGYDFISVLSLFSHLPDATFGRWLEVLYAGLNADGVLLFTTHGQFAADKTPSFFGDMLQGREWGFRPVSDQPDLDANSYGTMLVTPRYVFDLIHGLGARLLSFQSGPWFGLQDEWVIRKAG